MQVLAGYADGQAGAVGLEDGPPLPVPQRRAATVDVVAAQLGCQQVGTQPINRLNAARGQPDTTRTGRPRVRSRIIQVHSLSTRLAIRVILNHRIYLTERIEPREGPAPSLISPNCASPG